MGHPGASSSASAATSSDAPGTTSFSISSSSPSRRPQSTPKWSLLRTGKWTLRTIRSRFQSTEVRQRALRLTRLTRGKPVRGRHSLSITATASRTRWDAAGRPALGRSSVPQAPPAESATTRVAAEERPRVALLTPMTSVSRSRLRSSILSGTRWGVSVAHSRLGPPSPRSARPWGSALDSSCGSGMSSPWRLLIWRSFPRSLSWSLARGGPRSTTSTGWSWR